MGIVVDHIENIEDCQCVWTFITLRFQRIMCGGVQCATKSDVGCWLLAVGLGLKAGLNWTGLD